MILNYLREDELAELTKSDLINLKIEARYFQLTKLEAEIKSRLDKIDVYKFRYNEECFTVAKSYFLSVPFSAIANVMEKGLSVSDAFCEVDEIIKPASDDDTIYLERDDHNSSLQAKIISARNHLVFHQKYMVSKATYINFNICGWVVKVRSELAFMDTSSFFYNCNLYSCHCTRFYMDPDSNYVPLKICICGGKDCKSKKDIYGETDDEYKHKYAKKVIIDSLDKLKSYNGLISGNLLEDRSTAEICLNNLGILSVYKKLA